MISISINTVEKAIKELRPEIDEWVAKSKSDLEDFLLDSIGTLNDQEIKYLTDLIANWEKIVFFRPIELAANYNIYKLPSKGRKKRKLTFKENIITKAGYKKLRSKFYPIYFKKIGIKACVYCNAQLAVSVDGFRTKNRVKIDSVNAHFQVDHYISKSTHPCFSVSLFNLYPVCASCNNSKSDCDISFALYVEEDQLGDSPFYFEIKPGLAAEYLLQKDPSILDFTFHEPPCIPPIQTFDHTFDIDGIYRTQLDIIEELIVKASIYTDTYIDGLRKSFSRILDDASLFDRVILGNYTDAREIHKRPMAKFTQDIAAQLGFVLAKKS